MQAAGKRASDLRHDVATLMSYEAKQRSILCHDYFLG
jgi:hypothetical protein